MSTTTHTKRHTGTPQSLWSRSATRSSRGGSGELLTEQSPRHRHDDFRLAACTLLILLILLSTPPEPRSPSGAALLRDSQEGEARSHLRNKARYTSMMTCVQQHVHYYSYYYYCLPRPTRKDVPEPRSLEGEARSHWRNKARDTARMPSTEQSPRHQHQLI